jgi:NitT/TauT family transport system substrate-binding protein
MDGYVATQAWARKYPKTGAAFVRAIQEGQAIADTSPLAVQSAIAKYDDLPIKVTAVMAIPGFPTGSVAAPNIQRVANVMLEFGALSTRYSPEVESGALIRSMIS